MQPPEFWTRDDIVARAIRTALAPAAWLYAASVRWKRGHAKPYRSSAKVVCVGNLTAGGTGKTPVAMAIAERLKARGAKVSFLSRGYGGRLAGPHIVAPSDTSADVGDEPLLLARIAPAIVARDRAAGARLADAKDFDVIVMDDGFQNFAVTKDLSIIVVDGETLFGNGRVLPAGPLREPVPQGFDRADALIVVGGRIPQVPERFSGRILQAKLAADVGNFRDKPVVAFAGMGRPEKFFASLTAAGVALDSVHAFPDHHAFTAGELERLRAAARTAGASLVTTEKDFMRLAPGNRANIFAIPATLTFVDEAMLEALLDRVFPRALPRAGT